MHKLFFLKFIVVILLSNILMYCSSTIPSDTQLMREMNTDKVSAYELRNRLNVFAVRFSNTIERAADRISGLSDDPTIKENSLLWKMNSIPAANQAIFLSDPVAALIDISALCVQMRYYLEEGNGRQLFGLYQDIAVQAATDLINDVVKIWTVARNEINLDSIKVSVGPIFDWAKKYPINDISFLRSSVSDSLFAFMKLGDIGITETVGNIAISVYDIRERLTVYSDQMPKLARWQAEYLINKSLQNQNMMGAFNNFERITNSLNDITKIIEQTPELVNRLQYQTMAQLTAERIAVMDALTNERIAALSDIDRQRQVTLKYIDDFSGKVFSETQEVTQDLIDHFYLRLFQILVLIYLILLITFLVLRKIYWPGEKT
jgi:hypothetical protein